MIFLATLSACLAVALSLRPALALPPAPAGPARRERSLPSSPVLAGLSAGLTAALLLPYPLGVGAAVAAYLVTARWITRLEPRALRRRRGRLEAALPHVVGLMSTCLAAGTSPPGALARMVEVLDSPMQEELASFAARLDLGSDPVAVWTAMAAHPQLAPLGRALQRSAETGASVSDALQRLATELRAERRAAREAAARTIEVKASVPLGLCLLPAFVLVGIVPMVAGSFSLTFLGS